ncbi:MAG: autotransporter domain-containing protein [Pseudomonadales bacterium]|nr:autotransporter domain-containing protein [Pseudomonadales bacterium]
MLNIKRSLALIFTAFYSVCLSFNVLAAPPNAVNDSRQRTDGFDLVINVLDNDTDPDGDNLTVTSVSTASGGTATISGDNRSIEYKPFADFTGNDSFTYTITDDNGETATATVTIEFLQVNLPSFATNSNQRSIANALDTFCRALEEQENSLNATLIDVLARCNALFQLAANGQTDLLAIALQQIAPEEIASQTDTTLNFTKGQGSNIEQRLSEIKNGGPKVSAGGLALIFNGEKIPGKVIELLLGIKHQGGSAGNNSPDNKDSGNDPFEKLGLFINGNFATGERDATSNESGYEWEATGITLGTDYRINSRTIVGVAYGFSNDEVDFDNNGGATETDSSTVMLFGTYYYQKYYMDAYVGYGWGDFKSFRNIVYDESTDIGSTFSSAARSDTDHDQLFLSIASSMDYNRGAITISPYSSIDYAKTNIDAYTESNGNGWEIAFAGRSASSLRGNIGSRATYVINTKRYVLIPQARLAWIHEFKDSTNSAAAHFANDSSATGFDVDADGEDSDYFQLGIGASVVYTGGISGFFEYETNLGLANVSDHHYNLGVRYEAAF